MVYIVSYDLVNQRNYPRLQASIEKYNTVRVLLSVWLVQTQLSALELATDLVNSIDNDDRILVAELTHNTAWRGLMTIDSNMQQWVAAAAR